MPRGTMPSRKKILAYWSDKLWDAPTDTSMCWGCGFQGEIERCHLVPHVETQNNDPSNLVLLCRRCHRLQDIFCHMAGVDRFVDLIKDGALFMPIALAEGQLLQELIKENVCHSQER